MQLSREEQEQVFCSSWLL